MTASGEYHPKVRCYNVKETKNKYSELNNMALKGFEIVTYKADGPQAQAEVSHIKKVYLDFLLEQLKFSPETVYDGELEVYTVSVPEISLYGEGSSREEAIQDLLDSIKEYIALYEEQADFLTRYEPVQKQVAIMKLMRCENDEAIRKALGL